MKYLKADEIIDLELFVAEDERESEDYKSNRDFDFYSQAGERNKADDLNLLSFWINKMRALSGKSSVGKFAQMLYVIFGLAIILIGGFLGYLFGCVFSVYVSGIFWIFGACLFFVLSAFFLGTFARLINWKIRRLLKLILGERANIALVEAKNKNYFLKRGRFLSQFFGLSFIFAMFFSTYNNFENGNGIGEFNFSENTNVQTLHKTMEVIATPWSFTMGEGLLYPSVEDIELAKKNSYLGVEYQSAWRNFFLLGIFVYGILPSLIIFFVCFRGRKNGFGKYKILNSRDISLLLRRMKLSAANKSNWQGLKNDTDCKNLLLLRSDITNYSDIIKKRATKFTKFDTFNVHKYDFLSEFFTEDFDDMQDSYQNFTIAFMSDDYNEEVFENMQNLINTYPEKHLNVLLLGRFDKVANSFDELVSVEKSWWQRKLNAISTQNINIY